MRITTVISDVDGVIFDSESVHVRAWETALARHNIVLTKSIYDSGVGVCDREFLQDLQARGIVPGSISLEDLLEEKIAGLVELANEPVFAYPDAKETLTELSASFTLCAASNSAGRFTRRILEKSGLAGLFSLIVTRDDVARPKPAPDIYLKCASIRGVLPEECLVIEDTPVGVAAAKAAGMVCVAVTHTVPASQLGAADVVLETLSVRKIRQSIGVDSWSTGKTTITRR